MSRPGRLLPALLLLITLPAVAGAATAGAVAAADSTRATAPPDTVVTPPLPPAAGLAALMADSLGEAPPPPLITSWTRQPKATLRSGAQKVTYGLDFASNLTLRDRSGFSFHATESYDDYRVQLKTIERRSGSFSYNRPSENGWVVGLNLDEQWSLDKTTNSLGLTNENRRDNRTARASLRRRDMAWAGLQHDLVVNGSIIDQKGQQLGKRNDHAERQLDALWQGVANPLSGVTLATGLYGMTNSGDRALGTATSPSSTSGDTLRAGLYYDRGPVKGSVDVRGSSFEKRYLDYRRNNNGIVDTLDTSEKIVQELESNDAVTIAWKNTLQLRRFSLKTEVSRDESENRFRASGVGTRKRHQEQVNATIGWRVTRLDSVEITYKYLYKWDDQIYKGATAPRGKQISRNREAGLSWTHDLFANTRLLCRMRESLQQEIAEKEFNQNDRDRLEQSLRLESTTQWGGGNVKLVFEYRRLEDISIRRERSSNNNIKDSYEISPSFLWPVTSWLTVNQLYSLWIQYTDYVFSDLPSVSRTDNYNKRGNVTTKVTLKPNRRLNLSVRHDYNAKFNADKSGENGAGHAFYDRQLEQRVSKIGFDLSYKVTDWLTLEGTTYQSRDLKDTYGARVNETERFSGQLGVGGKVERNFGTGRKLQAGIHKFFNHGPNVQQATREYWDADIQLTWGF